MHDDVYIHSRTKDHSNSLVNQCAIVMPRILSSLEIVGGVLDCRSCSRAGAIT